MDALEFHREMSRFEGVDEELRLTKAVLAIVLERLQKALKCSSIVIEPDALEDSPDLTGSRDDMTGAVHLSASR